MPTCNLRGSGCWSGCRVTALPLKDYKKAMHSWGRDQEGQKFMFSFV